MKYCIIKTIPDVFISFLIDFRADGSDATQISLPTGNPFYLLRHTGNCQQVSSMLVIDETIKWYFQAGGTKSFGTVSPYEDGPADYLQLHFCYYS